MFKHIFVTAILATALIYGCTKQEKAIQPTTTSTGNYHSGPQGYALRGTGNDYSSSIPVDSANRLIQSYLQSVNYPANDSSLRSLSFSADSLRAYLSNTNIKTIKFMLAHQPAYVNGGHFGEFAGMNPQALTVVIVGLNSSDNYVLNNQNEVYEHCRPCPVHCNGVNSTYIY